mmetsp:Transcript_22564/g.77171  ORF Transcript_22564/g.77171 Transcript_22564/m.77171 type:complete len:245 (-) Transcript_22564:148-882(-)
MASVAGILRKTRLCFRILGALVCLLFTAQTIYVIADPKIEDIGDFCQWIGTWTLGLVVAAFGIGMEFKLLRGGIKVLTGGWWASCVSFTLNRLGLTIFYFWFGCYSMGGLGVADTDVHWESLANITGIISWVVAAGDFLLSFSCEAQVSKSVSSDVVPLDVEEGAGDTTEPEDDVPASKKPEDDKVVFGGCGVMLSAAPKEAWSLASLPSPEPTEANPFEGSAPAEGQPTGGWNTVAEKPFGAS